MKREKIIVAGATGLLGSHLVPFLDSMGYEVIGISSRKRANSDVLVDLSSKLNTFTLFDTFKPTTIINLVSLTSVEECEANPEKALKLNVNIVENIVDWIINNPNAHLIQISTDHVYDGIGPQNESCVNIRNKYAETKYAGEKIAEKIPSTIIRTNFVGKSNSLHRESMTDWLYKSIKNCQKLQVLTDVYFSPLSITYLVYIIEILIKKKLIGVYNIGSKNGMSKADFDFEFAKILNLPLSYLEPIKTSQAIFLKAYRPKDMRMDSSKFEISSGIKLPELSEILLQVASEYHDKF
jgi:dTDP-4-dehydrorhamnose reductase